MQNRHESLLAAEADTTATRTSDTNYAPHSRGLRLHVKTANKVGTTATYTPSVQAFFPDSGDYMTIWTAAAALTANGDYTYVLYPALLNGQGSDTEVRNIVVGGDYRVVLTVASADVDNNMDTEADVWELA